MIKIQGKVTPNYVAHTISFRLFPPVKLRLHDALLQHQPCTGQGREFVVGRYFVTIPNTKFSHLAVSVTTSMNPDHMYNMSSLNSINRTRSSLRHIYLCSWSIICHHQQFRAVCHLIKLATIMPMVGCDCCVGLPRALWLCMALLRSDRFRNLDCHAG